MVKKKLQLRQIRPTALIVGEGHAEEALLRHLRTLYTCNSKGVTLKINNARGKGAQNVIEHAVRQSKQASYDCVAALFDTDTDWTPALAKYAKSKKIVLLPSEPCLEAWLLDVAGFGIEGCTRDHKKRFLEKFGVSADTPGVFESHFAQSLLEEARTRVAVLDRILRILNP